MLHNTLATPAQPVIPPVVEVPKPPVVPPAQPVKQPEKKPVVHSDKPIVPLAKTSDITNIGLGLLAFATGIGITSCGIYNKRKERR